MDGWRGVKETWPAVVVGRLRLPNILHLTSLVLSYRRCNCIIGQLDCVVPFLENIFRFEPEAGQNLTQQPTNVIALGKLLRRGLHLLFYGDDLER